MSGRSIGRLVTVIAGLLALFVGAAACGVPQDAEPEEMSLDDLLGEADPTPTTVPTGDTSFTPIFFIGDANYLEKRDRTISRAGLVLEPIEVLEVLFAGPTEEESADGGLATAIAPDWVILDIVARPDSALVVDLAEDTLGALNNEDQRLAIAQMVFTLTALPGVDAVVFKIAGEFESIPTDGGSAEPQEAVDRNDYLTADLASRPPTPTPEPTATPVPLPEPDDAIPLDDDFGFPSREPTATPTPDP